MRREVDVPCGADYVKHGSVDNYGDAGRSFAIGLRTDSGLVGGA